METFEIHITGDPSIITASKLLGIKSIMVELLCPDRTYLRTEYMTSQVVKLPNYHACREYVRELEDKLLYLGVKIKRTKIESPCYDHYLSHGCYVESHFGGDFGDYPLSRNAKKDSYMMTDREYNASNYVNFIDKYKDVDVELCLYDTFPDEDLDWLNMYPEYCGHEKSNS